jgi:hypothetical protein
MVRSFLIVDELGVKRILFLAAILIVLLGFVFIFLASRFTDGYIISNPIMTYIIFLIILGGLFLIFLKVLFKSRRISIDFYSRHLIITGFSKKIFFKIFSFNDIKSITFCETKKHIIDHGEYWQKSIKIDGYLNVTLYSSIISNIINYSKLKELCGPFFQLDYIILQE